MSEAKHLAVVKISNIKLKLFLTFLIFSGINLCRASDTTEVKAVYCGHEIEASGCETEERKIKCGSQLIQWSYHTDQPKQVLDKIGEAYFKAVSEAFEKHGWQIKKEAALFLSFDNELRGWKVTNKRGKERRYFLWAYGYVGNEFVTINCVLDQLKPRKNETLPGFVREVIQIKE